MQTDWEKLGKQRLKKILQQVSLHPVLAKKRASHIQWSAEIQWVSGPAMKRLNFEYRQKDRVTDILSFPTPLFFQKQGILGELVICLPVLKKQAKELGHTPQVELDVLLVHGVLHLLGYDHEKNVRQANRMAALETEILKSLRKRVSLPFGLIKRAYSS